LGLRASFYCFCIRSAPESTYLEASRLNKSNLRIFSIALVALLVITSGGLVFGAWYLKQLEDTVTEKFEGRKWFFPSKIYSDSYIL
jgi:hypothetical protein